MSETVPPIRIELARVVAGDVRVDLLEVPTVTTLAQALEIALSLGLLDAGEIANATVGVHGLRKPPDHRLHPHDRIELTAALTVDPKIARQRRVAKRRAALPRDKWSPDRSRSPAR